MRQFTTSHTTSSTDLLKKLVLEELEAAAYSAVAKRVLRSRFYADEDAMRALEALGYFPPFEHCEAMAAPKHSGLDDILVFWNVDPEVPEEIHVHIWDQHGNCRDDDDDLVDHAQQSLWWEAFVKEVSQ